MAEIRLPNERRSSLVRTDTGTSARSGASGSSPSSSSQRRSALAHSVTTTSLKVTPAWSLIAFSAGSETVP